LQAKGSSTRPCFPETAVVQEAVAVVVNVGWAKVEGRVGLGVEKEDKRIERIAEAMVEAGVQLLGRNGINAERENDV
jgi:hypothetical protein